MLKISDIRNNIDKIIKYYEEQEEDAGMDGDLQLSEMYSECREKWIKAKEELSVVRNVILIPEVNRSELTEVAPHLDLREFSEILTTFCLRKEFEIERMNKELADLKDLNMRVQNLNETNK